MGNINGSFEAGKHSFCLRRWCGVSVLKRSLVQYVAGGVCCLGVLLLVILLPMSIKDIDHSEVAVRYDRLTKEVFEEPLSEGRHFVPPSSDLITYNSKFITLEETISCLSKDGLELAFTVAFQYQVKRENLKSIVFKFGQQSSLTQVIKLTLIDVVRDVCSEVPGEEYFTKRAPTERRLDELLRVRLTDAEGDETTVALLKSDVIVGFMQLKNIHLGARFAQAIEQKQLAIEEIDIALSQRKEILIKEQTELLRAREDVRIQLVQAGADVNSVLFRAAEVRQQRQAIWGERAKEVKFGMESLSYSASLYLSDYLWPKLLANQIDPQRQACVEKCKVLGDCWACWVSQVATLPSALDPTAPSRG